MDDSWCSEGKTSQEIPCNPSSTIFPQPITPTSQSRSLLPLSPPLNAHHHTGEDRLSLVSRNLAILRSIFDSMQPINPDAILLLVANPVDVITHFARKISGLPPSQVLGTGTSLDSARLRGALATELDVAPNSVNAFVLGEHGDSQFVRIIYQLHSTYPKPNLQVHWSGVSVGTTPLSLLHGSSLTPEFKDRVSKHTAGAAASIIAAKGCTAFGIGNIAASLCKYILYDQRTVRPVSFYQEDLGVTLSMPAVVGRKGIVRSIPVELDEEEKKALEKTAKALREVIEKSEKELDKMEKEDK